MSKIMGLDLSLTGTGIVGIAPGEEPYKKLIKSKPGDKTPLGEIERLLGIKAEIQIILNELEPELVVIEGLAFGVKKTTALAQLAGLNYLIREFLVLKKIPFLICAPSTLKKFIIGKGNGDKNLMLLETFKHYGISFTDDNLCDAHGLAQCGAAVVGENTLPLIKPQKEVVELLKTQILKSSHQRRKPN